jgi:hypothetical protein
VRKGWAAVILQRTEQRIHIDLIARASQITAAVIAAEVVSKRRDGAAAVEDVFARRAGIQDCVGDLNEIIPVVMNAPPEGAELPVIVLLATSRNETTL